MKYVPYGVGAFMLTPLLLWAGLWVFAFEGPKTGFEDPVTVAMIGVSLGPVTGMMPARLVQGEQPGFELELCDVDRFA